MFKKILIANRGEIACRIARTCRRLGVGVATVHSEADRDALHVREVGESVELGPAPAGQSYLAVDKVVAAARRVGADAVHPGYGFLAENPAFARALAGAGLAFVGPTPDVLARFGDKAAAKAEARAAGVPVVPGTGHPTDSVEAVVSAVASMRLPVLLKAAAGGGGKGMRVVTSAATLRADVEAAMREGRGAFGDGRLIVEEFLPEARHVEVQILGDGQGNVIHLLDRECSLQRRHQKVVEEAPVLSLDPEVRASVLDHAVRLGAAVAYRGLGTVEFIVKDGRAYFLEVNPRIQVEHPVTEEITGLDLVELQLRAVAEGRLPLAQDDVRAKGVALEARLYAEDPSRGFLPSTGVVEALVLPSQLLRVDTGVEPGSAVTSHYDPMLAKLIAWGPDRDAAYARLRAGLAATAVLGVTTNLAFLRALADDPRVAANQVHTGTVDVLLAAGGATPAADGARPDAPNAEDAAIAAALWLRGGGEEPHTTLDAGRNALPAVWGGWSSLTGWRFGDGTSTVATAPALRLRWAGPDAPAAAPGERWDVRFGAPPGGSGGVSVEVEGHGAWEVRLRPRADGSLGATVGDRLLALEAVAVTGGHVGFAQAGRSVRFAAEPYLASVLLDADRAGDGRVRAPMMGRVVAVSVEAGHRVEAGERLGVIESMKMEITLSAPHAGVVEEVACRADATVERDQVMFVVASHPGAVPPGQGATP